MKSNMLIHFVLFNVYDSILSWKAAEAAHDYRQTKQDRYEEMRRRKDEEREAQERLLVRSIYHLILILNQPILHTFNECLVCLHI